MTESYIYKRNRHISTLREVAHDGTVERGAWQSALNWAVKRLEGLPEHWVALDNYNGAIEAGAEEIAESQRLRAEIERLTRDRDLWKERHDRERAAHAKNLTEQQKVEAERDGLREAVKHMCDELCDLGDCQAPWCPRPPSSIAGEP